MSYKQETFLDACRTDNLSKVTELREQETVSGDPPKLDYEKGFLLACEHGSTNVALYLIKTCSWDTYSPDVSKLGSLGLYYACLKGKEVIVTALLKYGIIPDSNWYRSLFAAASGGHHQIVELLFEYNMNPFVTDIEGWNALHYAHMAAARYPSDSPDPFQYHSKYEETISLLESFGVPDQPDDSGHFPQQCFRV